MKSPARLCNQGGESLYEQLGKNYFISNRFRGAHALAPFFLFPEPGYDGT